MKQPRIGVAVFVIKDDRFLVGLRTGSHGTDTWNLPGGHLEFSETVEDCAEREVKEEAGLVINTIQKAPYTEDFFEKEQKHYITLFTVAHWKSGEPQLREPEKCKEWRWVTFKNLPQPLFLPLKNLIDTGFNPFK